MKVIPTIQQFLESLDNPSEKLLNTLRGGELRPESAGGKPQMVCLSRFAEATLTQAKGAYRLALPLSAEAATEARRTLAQRAVMRSPHLAPATYLSEAFTFCDTLGVCHTADLVVEELPAGRPLHELLPEGVAAEQLIAALNRLQADFQKRQIAHNNLKPENLWLTEEGEFLVLRGYRMAFDGSSEADAASFSALEKLIRTADNRTAAMEEHPEHRLRHSRRFDEVGCMKEGLICVRQNGLYGYLDSDERWVIEPRFLWAEAFREGRAEVKTESGYGVIDKQGDYILHPCCERVEWDEMSGTIRARIEGQERLFDYDGEEL